MGGDLPKVLYEVADRPMVWWVIQACRKVGVQQCILVIGYRSELVKMALKGEEGIAFVEQTEQLGTAHAAKQALPLIPDGARPVFVLAGDGPLIRPETLQKMLDVHKEKDAAATMATAVIGDPAGYGRIVRDSSGQFEAIVEHKDATPAQRDIREINPSYYCFDSQALTRGIPRIGNDNRQGEYYITDLPGILKADGQTVAVIDAVPEEDVLSINTPEQLSDVDAILRNRLSRDPVAAETAT